MQANLDPFLSLDVVSLGSWLLPKCYESQYITIKWFLRSLIILTAASMVCNFTVKIESAEENLPNAIFLLLTASKPIPISDFDPHAYIAYFEVSGRNLSLISASDLYPFPFPIISSSNLGEIQDKVLLQDKWLRTSKILNASPLTIWCETPKQDPFCQALVNRVSLKTLWDPFQLILQDRLAVSHPHSKPIGKEALYASR